MIAYEQHHNTADQVQDYLQGALAIVAELEVDDELRVPCFLKAVDLLSAKTLQCVPTATQQLAISKGVGIRG